jgi:hypothetical protein
MAACRSPDGYEHRIQKVKAPRSMSPRGLRTTLKGRGVAAWSRPGRTRIGHCPNETSHPARHGLPVEQGRRPIVRSVQAPRRWSCHGRLGCDPSAADEWPAVLQSIIVVPVFTDSSIRVSPVRVIGDPLMTMRNFYARPDPRTRGLTRFFLRSLFPQRYPQGIALRSGVMHTHVDEICG